MPRDVSLNLSGMWRHSDHEAGQHSSERGMTWYTGLGETWNDGRGPAASSFAGHRLQQKADYPADMSRRPCPAPIEVSLTLVKPSKPWALCFFLLAALVPESILNLPESSLRGLLKEAQSLKP